MIPACNYVNKVLVCTYRLKLPIYSYDTSQLDDYCLYSYKNQHLALTFAKSYSKQHPRMNFYIYSQGNGVDMSNNMRLGLTAIVNNGEIIKEGE